MHATAVKLYKYDESLCGKFIEEQHRASHLTADVDLVTCRPCLARLCSMPQLANQRILEKKKRLEASSADVEETGDGSHG